MTRKRIAKINYNGGYQKSQRKSVYDWDSGALVFGSREETRGTEGSPVPKEKRVVNNQSTNVDKI